MIVVVDAARLSAVLVSYTVTTTNYYTHKSLSIHPVYIAPAIEAMGLPDERPRHSVANLIGRFEKQTKRQSASAASLPSRSSSVVSHVTEDSAKEEAKEKPEWPPKSLAQAMPDKPAVVIPGYTRPGLMAGDDTATPVQTERDEPEGSIPPQTDTTLDVVEKHSTDDPADLVENWRKDIPAAEEQVIVAPVAAEDPDTSKLPTPTLTSTKKVAHPGMPRTIVSKPAAAKSSTSKASTSAARPVTKPTATKPMTTPTKSSLATSVSQPLKPQPTGQSIGSSASASATSKRLAVKATPTPARSKTPSTLRSKTPTTAVPRPKTPSSGLFAPTAASLAKSRSPPPPVPTAVKKPALSTDAVDRLSKPTAASLSKTRSLAAGGPTTPSKPSAVKATTSPSKTPSSSGTRPVSKTTPSKPRAPTSAPKATSTAKKAPAKASSAGPKVAGGPAVAATVAAIGVVAAAIDSLDQEAVSAEPIVPDDPVDEQSDGTEGEAEEESYVSDGEATPKSPSPAPVEHSIDVDGEEEEEEEEEEVGYTPSAKDDLLDIVNMLEGASITKPVHYAHEIQDIPDMEDK